MHCHDPTSILQPSILRCMTDERCVPGRRTAVVGGDEYVAHCWCFRRKVSPAAEGEMESGGKWVGSHLENSLEKDEALPRFLLLPTGTRPYLGCLSNLIACLEHQYRFVSE
jgi:hypothetical protein